MLKLLAPLAVLVLSSALFALHASAAPAGRCTTVVYPSAGRYSHTLDRLHGPGLLLMGGGPDIDAAFVWMQRTLTGGASRRGGNLIVVRADGDNDYDRYIAKLAPYRSVRTILIPPCATRSQVDAMTSYVDGADAVFFAGGDQANYARWKGSRLMAAVQRVYDRGGVVGGTSAGLAIQGAVAYDSVAADRLHPGDDNYEVRTPDATRNPFEPEISFTVGLLRYPPLADTITDTHFVVRNRFGRLAAFMARILHDHLIAGKTVYGLGVDQSSALVVDRRGVATLLKGLTSSQGAYLVTGTRPARIEPGKPLLFAVCVQHISRAGARFDLFTKHGEAARYCLTVDGSKKPPYSRNPY